MNRTEKLLWHKAKTILPGITARVENLAHSGYPDVHGIFEGQDYWVELKVIQTKKPVWTNEMLFKLLQETQVVWAIMRIKYAKYRRLFMLVGHKKGMRLFKIVIMNELFTFEYIAEAIQPMKEEDKLIFKLRIQEVLCQ
jgi:hypothetical protein